MPEAVSITLKCR